MKISLIIIYKKVCFRNFFITKCYTKCIKEENFIMFWEYLFVIPYIRDCSYSLEKVIFIHMGIVLKRRTKFKTLRQLSSLSLPLSPHLQCRIVEAFARTNKEFGDCLNKKNWIIQTKSNEVQNNNQSSIIKVLKLIFFGVLDKHM